MRFEGSRIAGGIRALLWIAPFYILILVMKIYYVQRPNLAHSIHILTLGIVSGAFLIGTILYQSRNEKDNRKQCRHLLSAAALSVTLYALCCLLAFSFSGKWVFLCL